MKTLLCTKRIAIAVVLAVATLSLTPSIGQAGHCHSPRLRTVVTWQVQQRPVTVYRTRFGHCGRPYRVKQVVYLSVRVPALRVVQSDY